MCQTGIFRVTSSVPLWGTFWYRCPLQAPALNLGFRLAVGAGGPPASWICYKEAEAWVVPHTLGLAVPTPRHSAPSPVLTASSCEPSWSPAAELPEAPETKRASGFLGSPRDRSDGGPKQRDQTPRSSPGLVSVRSPQKRRRKEWSFEKHVSLRGESARGLL